MDQVSVSIDVERCKACSYCVDVCPKKIIELSSQTNSKGYHYASVDAAENCTGCRFCAIVCPELAIQLSIVKQVMPAKSDR